ncbi:MAG TPA: MFS transporter [Streptosporangiaceae bacterium]|nr:MFS transporter [Streptosporangiaceae bacterium]
MVANEARQPAGAGEPSQVRPLRNSVMRAIILSETISALGSQMTYLVLPWFVLVTTGSATRMGLVFAIELVPVALLGIPAGLAVQRLGVRRTMLIGDSARGVLIALVPVLYQLHALSFGALLAIVFCVGIFSGPYVSAQRLVIPETFGDSEALVVQGNALLESATRLTSLLGPAMAGLLIGVLGAVHVLWFDAASFVISFGILAARLPRPERSMAGAEGSSGVLAGARFVLGNPLLRRVSAAALLFGLFFPALLASLPVVADRRFDANPKVAGLLFAAWGAGALIGLYGVMRFASKLPPIRMGALAAVALALPLWLLALPLNAWQFGLVLLVSGVFTPMLNAPLITLILLRTPEELRAQVIAFVMTANLLAGPLGYALAGPALQAWGLRTVLLVVAAGISVAALLMSTIIKVDAAGAEPASEESLGAEPMEADVVAHGEALPGTGQPPGEGERAEDQELPPA